MTPFRAEDDRETRTLFHCVDFTLTQRALAGRPAPTTVVALRARLEAAIRDTTGHATTSGPIGVREASRILRCGERHVRRFAPEMGGTVISGRWVFDREKVEEFARAPRVRRYRKCPRTD
ncbi:hypothetical protein [Nocardia anaemiae]|uniref:hypothetical protein n=1 Tax=Nocardia anaemiae TaxID=263910 RepID=UPI0007A4D00C|nr:hypothetical protein [Nocardia anaemiae]